MNAVIRAGTSGFSFKEWKGTFYPEKIAARDMLRFYAERFSTVEINNTFYRMPKEPVLAGWSEQVPAGFLFALKASQYITHIRRLREPAEPIARLVQVTAALGPTLGPVLFQLPPNLRLDLPLLEDFVSTLPADRRSAMEFRHPSWFDDEVDAALSARGVALCIADTGEEPVAPLVATAGWGYLRLRREDLGDDDLSQWAARIREQPWSEAFVFLKHEEEGKGPKFAARLMEIASA